MRPAPSEAANNITVVAEIKSLQYLQAALYYYLNCCKN